MKNMGDAIMGTGIAMGEEKAILAAQQAINSPLLQNASIQGAKGLLVNVTGPKNMTMRELNDASNIIYQESGENANVILGCVIDPNLNDEIRITVIATGLNNDDNPEIYNPHSEVDIQKKYFEHSTEINEGDANIELSKKLVEENKLEKNNDTMKFGEDLDIPTFLRNRKI